MQQSISRVRPVSLLTVLAILFAFVPGATFAQTDNSTQPYIIIAQNDTAFDLAESNIPDAQIDTDATLEDHNVIAAELTAKEAKALKSIKNCIIEPDFELIASALEDEDEPAPHSRTPEEVAALKEAYWANMQTYLQRTTIPAADVQWNMQAVDADAVVEHGTNVTTPPPAAKINIAVLDSGVDMVRGLELAASVNLIPGESELSPLFLDLAGHGTAVASVIAGNPQNDIQGVNPNAAITSVKVLDGGNKAPISRIIEGIYWCIDHDINIINMSFGTSTYSRAFEKSIQDAADAGILMVAASGNNGGAVEYPAAFAPVMAVAATGTNGEVTAFSNTVGDLDIAAPGENIPVLGAFGLQGVTHGTSFAVPHITGAASLLWQKDPTKPAAFIRALLDESARSVDNADCGQLDLQFALDHYAAFAANWNGEVLDVSETPDNFMSPTVYECVDAENGFVEGRWGQYDHAGAAQCGYENLNEYRGTSLTWAISDIQKKVLKVGSIYQDYDPIFTSNKSSGITHPELHGLSAGSVNDPTGATTSSPPRQVNYIACYELLTKLALKAGNTDKISWSANTEYGLVAKNFEKICDDIYSNDNGTSGWIGGIAWDYAISWSSSFIGITDIPSYDSRVSSTKKTWRELFLWGMAIHQISDVYAHNAYLNRGGSWKLLAHAQAYANQYPTRCCWENGGADDSGAESFRYTAAMWSAECVCWCAAQGIEGDWWEFQPAHMAAFYNSPNQPRFKLRKLKTYAQQNGCTSSSWLSQFNAISIGD